MGYTMSVKNSVSIWRKISNFSTKYPLTRGMAAYAVIWPCGSALQQYLEGRETIDFYRVGRYFLYGSFYVAPTLSIWMRIARTMWPQNNITSALTKAVIEQFTYTPFAMVSFYFGMSLLEGKSTKEASDEVSEKFLPTYKAAFYIFFAYIIMLSVMQVGVCVWPVLQTINYTMIAEKNRVPFVSMCSLVWTTFLAYMKHLEGNHFKQHLPVSSYHDKK